MAIENDDLLVLQKNGGGTLRKASVGALLAGVITDTPDLQVVTDEGSITTNGATFGDTVIQGDFDFADEDTSGTRLENNGGIRSKIRTGNTHSSYTAYLGNDVTIDLKYDGAASFVGTVAIGGTDLSPNISLNADGSGTFVGPLEAESIDGGEYAT